MSTPPTPPPDGTSLPPRQRLNLGKLMKDATEKDLWALDDLDPKGERPPEATEVLPRNFKKRQLQLLHDEPVADIPVLSDVKNDQDLPAVRPEDESRNLKVNASPKQPKPTLRGESPRKSKPLGAYDELDTWDEPDAAPVTRSNPKKARISGSPPVPLPAELPDELHVPPPSETPGLPEAGVESHEEYEAPPAIPKNLLPAFLKPNLHLSKLERTGLAALAIFLLVAGTLIYFSTVNRLHGTSGMDTAPNFPIAGLQLSILEADTFWRAPLTEGVNRETFRRGTQLLPVLEMTTRGGPAGVRVFFRNSEGNLMGDVVTRRIEAGRDIQVAATVGFDDIGMHSAYRTGQSKPWTIEVHEAPSESSPAAAYKKLFQISISPDRR